MKHLSKTRDLYDELYKYERIEKKQMNFLKGGEGPEGGSGGQPGSDDPPIAP